MQIRVVMFSNPVKLRPAMLQETPQARPRSTALPSGSDSLSRSAVSRFFPAAVAIIAPKARSGSVSPPVGPAVSMIVNLIRISIFTAALLGMHSSHATGQVFDVTGEWEGKLTCKRFSGEKSTFSAEPVVSVSQNGNAIGMRVDFGGGSVQQYTGLANPDGKKPDTKGEFALIRCGTDSVAGGTPTDEVGRFTAATKTAPAIKATFKGTSVFSEATRLGTCKWKGTRTSLTDPGVATSCVP